jgi:hypothetical protein
MNKVTRPQNALTLYPQNSDGTILSVNVSTTAINIRYTSSAVQTETVNYVGKSLEDLCLEINSLVLPIKAVPTIRNTILDTGDLFTTDTTSYFQVPEGFPLHDRIINKGVVIRSNRYSVRHKQQTNLKLLQPYSNSAILPWYPIVTNGEFTTKDSGKTFRFSVPEYHSQSWSLRYGKPFRDVLGEKLLNIKEGMFKVNRTPLFWNGENINLYNNDILLSPSLIEDVDVNNGFIYTKPSFPASAGIRVDYSYLESNYEYKALNINAHINQNPSLLNKFVLIYAIPLEGIDYLINKRTLYHKIADSIDEAINNIEVSNRNYPVAILGGYSIQQVIISDRVSILDTRSRGGGLIREEGPDSPAHNIDPVLSVPTSSPVEDQYRESKFYFDIGNFDGEVYPGAGSVVIDLPLDLQDKISISDIKARTTKFLAAGVYPVFSYYDKPLPSVSGLSSQISLLMNGSLIESDGSASGSCWTKSPIELPGHASTGTWTEATADLLTSISRIDMTGVLLSTPSNGIFQSYLKSTPTAGIEYYLREVTIHSGSKDDQYAYTPWKRVRTVDDREVPNGQIIKGFISFPRSLNTSEFRSITVNSPFRLDNTGELKSDIASEISSIHSAVLARTTPKEFTASISSSSTEVLTGMFITHNLASIDQQIFSAYPDYEGASAAYNYLFDLQRSTLSGTYTGASDLVGRQLIQVLGDSSYTGRMKFFSVAAQSYNDYSADTTDIDISLPLIQLSSYGLWRKEIFSTGDYIYNQIVSKMTGILNNHNVLVNGSYYPKTYNYTIPTAGDPPSTISGPSFIIPELSGFSNAEIIESNNNDFDYLYSTPGIISVSRLIDNFSGAFATGIRSVMQTAWSGVADAIVRMPMAVTDTRTNNGFPVVQHWYNPYNRYGTYAGSLSKQIIDCCEYLYEAQYYAHSGVTWNGTPGTDVKTLATGIRYVTDVLSTAYDGFKQTVMRGGILDQNTADLLYGYGWYAKNYAARNSYITGFNTGSSIPDYVVQFSGIFHTGLYTLIKGMTTTNGDILETQIVNGDQGPFEVKVPAKILGALSVACELDKAKYLPLTQAVFNTIKNRYSSDGFYYLDPLKSVDLAGYEDTISPYLVKLYKSI